LAASSARHSRSWFAPPKDGSEQPLGQEASECIWRDLQARGYLDAAGDIQDSFQPDSLLFKLEIADEFEDLRSAIVDEMRKYVFKNRIANAHKKQNVAFNKQVHLREDFRELWTRISQKTRYRVHFETSELIDKAVSRLTAMERIRPLMLTSTRVDVEITKAGISADRQLEHKTQVMEGPRILPDIIAFLQKETELTRHTLAAILRSSGRLSEFRENPQQFMALVACEIGYAMHDLMLEGIQYEKIAGEYWEMQRIEDEAEKGISRYLKDLYAVQNRDKSPFDYVEFESEVEQRFAADLW
jgi:type III restriction enzyme